MAKNTKMKPLKNPNGKTTKLPTPPAKGRPAPMTPVKNDGT